MNHRKFVRLEGDTIKVLSQSDETTTLRVLVTAFGSPEKKDLHGEFFHKSTDFGDELGIPVKAFYEHGMNDLVNPHMPNNRQVIGTAKFAEATDEGRWYEFEVMRSHAYHDAIFKLVNEKVLGASTQCYENQRSAPTETGAIDRWLESEVSLTVTPADFKTIGRIAAIVKSFNLPEMELSKSLAKLVEDATSEDVDALADEINKMFFDDVDADAEGESTEDVDATEETDDNTDSESAEELSLEGLTSAVKTLTESLQAFSSDIALIKSAVTDKDGEVVPLSGISTRTKQTNRAMRALAGGVAKTVKGGFVPLDEQPDEEDEEVNHKSYVSTIPAHAPGG